MTWVDLRKIVVSCEFHQDAKRAAETSCDPRQMFMRWNGWIAIGCAVLGVCVAGVGDLEAQLPPVPAGATAVAQGLFGPRGMKFGPDGDLYVALSGPGGTNSTADACPELQVPPEVGGPYTNG